MYRFAAWLTLFVSGCVATAEQALPDDGRTSVWILTGANNHDWEWTSTTLRSVLDGSGKFRARVVPNPAEALTDPEQAAELRRVKAFVLDYNGPRWGDEAEAAFLDAVRGGTGVVVVHAANNAFTGWEDYERLVGHLWRQGTGHGKYHEFDVKVIDRDHPVTKDLPDLEGHPDELYHRLVQPFETKHRILATAWSDPETGGTGEDEPMIMVASFGDGRVFHTPLGHVWRGVEASRASYDEMLADLIVRGTEWAATGRVTPTEWPEPNELTGDEVRGGWRMLFDGESTAAWHGHGSDAFPAQGWVVDGGTLKSEKGGGGGDLVTRDSFSDFELELEWKLAPDGNSGIFYRLDPEADVLWTSAIEYQILDDYRHPNGQRPLWASGAIYDLAPIEHRVLRPDGDWNHARIVARGNRIEHWFNGVRVARVELGTSEWLDLRARSKFAGYEGFADRREGPLGIQDHGEEVWFRNVKVRDLPAGGWPIEASSTRDDPVELFDGESLAGWTGYHKDDKALDEVWSVKDGLLVTSGAPAGYARTVDTFEDFVLELEWRWNPETKQAGNSGVLLRMNGEDKVWPKSVEAQLHSGNAGDIWNIQGTPIGVDPARTEGRRTKKLAIGERPVGEWNHYRIELEGDTMRLWVNGVFTNSCTGVMRTPGSVCLQSEGTEIQFRKIRIWPRD